MCHPTSVVNVIDLHFNWTLKLSIRSQTINAHTCGLATGREISADVLLTDAFKQIHLSMIHACSVFHLARLADSVFNRVEILNSIYQMFSSKRNNKHGMPAGMVRFAFRCVKIAARTYERQRETAGIFMRRVTVAGRYQAYDPNAIDRRRRHRRAM